MKTQSLFWTALTAVAFCGLAVKQMRKASKIDLRGKVVLITGGSRGLGLALAREFAQHGAIIAICARSEKELGMATDRLRTSGAQAHSFVCNISHLEQVHGLISDITSSLGPIDILVNNAGVIKVGSALNMELQDFEEAMDVMFWGMLQTTLSVLPAMLERGQGSIVNITSIGGKVPVPHLLPYCCAKFAAVALSEGLGVELAPLGIRVTTVVPGLMRTGSHLNATFKGQHEAEYSWFAAGAATPLVSMSAARAARAIVRATTHGERESILSFPARTLNRTNAIAPSLVRVALDTANRFLPGSGSNGHSVRGSEIEEGFTSAVWKAVTVSGRRAAVSLNEIYKEDYEQDTPIICSN